MTVPENFESRKAYREALVRILDTIRGVDSYYITPDQCIQANIIEPAPLVLVNHSPLKTDFFIPYLGDIDYSNYYNLERLNDYLDDYLVPPRPQQAPGICYKPWTGNFNFGNFLEPNFFWKMTRTCPASTDPESRPRSQKGIKETLSHMKCIVETDVIGDDRLIRSELITVLQVMRGRLHTKYLRSHIVAPDVHFIPGLIMLFSIMGPFHLRVLETYYNGDKVIVRKTKLYDMREYNPTMLDLLHRWSLGYACGRPRYLRDCDELGLWRLDWMEDTLMVL